MIGIYGITAAEEYLNLEQRQKAFSLMSGTVDSEDFNNIVIQGRNLSLGMTCRNIGENKDLALRSFSDSAVIAFSGYAKFSGEPKLYWADDMVNRIYDEILQKKVKQLKDLEGSFLCAIFHRDELTMVCDRFGSKNLFYCHCGGALIFAPEVKRIIKSNLVSRKRNHKGAIQIMVTGFFLDDSTLVEDVKRIPFASIMKKNTAHNKDPIISKYWSIPAKEGLIDEVTHDLVDRFHASLQSTINELVLLEDRYTVPLSGGLDSRAIACFLAGRGKLKTITYDCKDEADVAHKVAKVLNTDFNYFSNDMLKSEYFRTALYKMHVNQEIHSVVNQYFYSPLFRQYCIQNENRAIYDGVYMDILFSGPYCYNAFDYDKFINTYGYRNIFTLELMSKIGREAVHDVMSEVYNNGIKEIPDADGLGLSQYFYLNGRLRRLVLESGSSRESYCYVFKPGFNHELADLGYSLGLRVRRGVLYLKMLNKYFPEVMSVKFKDSYGIRKMTYQEKISSKFINFRMKLANVTDGMIKYYPYQLEYYFYHDEEIEKWKKRVFEDNHVTDLFNEKQLKNLLERVSNKQYVLNIFQRLMFLQQFNAELGT